MSLNTSLKPLLTLVRHLGYSWSPGRTLKEMGTLSARRLAQKASQVARCTALYTTSRPVKATKAMGRQHSSGGSSHWDPAITMVQQTDLMRATCHYREADTQSLGFWPPTRSCLQLAIVTPLFLTILNRISDKKKCNPWTPSYNPYYLLLLDELLKISDNNINIIRVLCITSSYHSYILSQQTHASFNNWLLHKANRTFSTILKISIVMTWVCAYFEYTSMWF